MRDDHPTIANSAAMIGQVLQSGPRCSLEGIGRGIVIAGGGGRYAACAYVGVSRLRELGCELPVELWYLGEGERDDCLFDMLGRVDVSVIDANEVTASHPHESLRGWALKPYAILHSKFREVLFLDADNSPLRDPSFLFETPEYQEIGALFWPDFWKTSPHSRYWNVMGVPFQDGYEFESGQIVVNKERCLPALCLTNWICERGERFYWTFCHGDKDCFRAAWWRTNTPFALASTPVIAIDDKAMLQHDFQGNPLFQHRQIAKWQLSGNPRLRGFDQESECLAAVARFRVEKLRRRFDLSSDDLVMTNSLGRRRYRYHRCGYDCRDITFSEDCEVGDGRAALEAMYFIKDGELYIVDCDMELTCRLRSAYDLWTGRWVRFERMPITLEPVPS